MRKKKRTIIYATLSVFTCQLFLTSNFQVKASNSDYFNSSLYDETNGINEETLKKIQEHNIFDKLTMEVTGSADAVESKNKVLLTVTNENGGLRVRADALEDKTDYILGFTYKKTAGKLNSFGGHTDGVWQNNIAYVNGKKTMEFTENKSIFVNDDENEYRVEVHFTTPKDVTSNSSLFIQPNRGEFDDVTVELKDFYLVEAKALNN